MGEEGSKRRVSTYSLLTKRRLASDCFFLTFNNQYVLTILFNFLMKDISTKSSAQRQNIRTEKIWSQRGVGPVRQTGHFSYKKVRGKPTSV